jgi:hypothetical protein
MAELLVEKARHGNHQRVTTQICRPHEVVVFAVRRKYNARLLRGRPAA